MRLLALSLAEMFLMVATGGRQRRDPPASEKLVVLRLGSEPSHLVRMAKPDCRKLAGDKNVRGAL